MKAVICTKYGSPDVLKLQEVPQPIPNHNEVLIKVHRAIVGPADCAFRKGDPFIVKLIYGLTKPRIATQGVEFSGEIESIGKDVKLFKKGDQVYGISADKFGAHAEYFCLPEDKPFVLKPEKMSYDDAVAISDGAPTSLIFLRDKAKLKPGQKILINGASGSVGVYGIQLAKYFGAEVTAVCSGKNIDHVKSLGADHVIDYTLEDFTMSNEKYDVVFDVVAKSSFGECKNLLTKNGIYLSTFPSLSIVFQMLWTSKFSSKKAIFAATGLLQNKENLNFLSKLFEDGKIKAAIDKRYSLEQIQDAHTYVETGHKRGNVILKIR